MRKALLFGLAALLSTAALADNSFEFHGYGRAGTLFDFEGYDQGLLVQKNMVGRLGNEPDTYWEMELVKNLSTNGLDSKWHLMLANGSESDGTWIAGDIAFRQAYGEIKGALANKDLNVWAGKRFYNRADVHITDFYYRDYSGTGGGVQGLADGKLDLAYIAADGVGDTIDGTTMMHNLQAKYKLNDKVELNGTVHFLPHGEDVNPNYSESGLQGDLTYNLPGFYGTTGGFSNIVVQGGVGIGSSLGNFYGGESYDGDSGVRLLTQGGKDINDKWAILAQSWLQFNSNDPDSGLKDSSAFSVVGRPIYKVNQNISLQTEIGYGYSEVKDEDGINQFKLTFAPTLHLGTDVLFGRPQLRTFITYGSIDEGGYDEDYLAGGVQAEVWF